MFMPTIANHSEPFLLRVNLQHFAGEEVVDLPVEESLESPSFEETDDFLSFEDELESAEDTTPVDDVLNEEEELFQMSK
ncbi:hypothetical protein [Paenisporosarcina cavernae]|uniref:Uncharacterized protein n=1 Tax=Paenisporosarcina cavernae TaxID=2320858 RepID=A0A385YUP5_9BACL|nr:hypothetical protein [Paenisporosarcina cavernae]AYC30010.1 hypothetical protein D3873_09050 [Paenisporosarcina cavernae]